MDTLTIWHNCSVYGTCFILDLDLSLSFFVFLLPTHSLLLRRGEWLIFLCFIYFKFMCTMECVFMYGISISTMVCVWIEKNVIAKHALFSLEYTKYSKELNYNQRFICSVSSFGKCPL